jgi:threonine dehydratase
VPTQVHGAQWADAHVRAGAVASAESGSLIHPFEGDDTWEGHGTLVEEIYAQRGGRAPAGLVVSVGGGGLLLGVLRVRPWVGLARPSAVELSTHAQLHRQRRFWHFWRS